MAIRVGEHGYLQPLELSPARQDDARAGRGALAFNAIAQIRDAALDGLGLAYGAHIDRAGKSETRTAGDQSAYFILASYASRSSGDFS